MLEGDEARDADAVLRKICREAASKIVEGKHDVELLGILKSRIVTPSPDKDAVEKAAADIRKLAEGRAKP